MQKLTWPITQSNNYYQAVINTKEGLPFPTLEMNINLHMVHNLHEDLILGSDFIRHVKALTSKKKYNAHFSPPDNNILLGQTQQKHTMRKTRTTDIHNIPNEIMVKILSCLTFQEICTFGKTNTVMRDLTQNHNSGDKSQLPLKI